MNYILKITQSNLQGERLKKAITELLNLIKAGAVYVSYHDIRKIIVVTFILKNDDLEDQNILTETVQDFIKSYPDFIFKFINSRWANNGFEKCKPYFFQHCTIKELVYLEPNAKVFYPNKSKSKELIKKARRRFFNDIEAAVVTFRNVSIYSRTNKNIETAFTLHQTLRYIFICASEFLTPEFISSTCLLTHYNYVIDFAPTLKNILNQDIESDLEILIQLNTAYKSIIQNQIIRDIDRALIARAKVKIELIQREVNNLFAEYIDLCKEKTRELNRQNFMGKSIFHHKIRPNYFIDDALSKISNLLTETFKIRSIYCFGYATIHDFDGKLKTKNYSKELPRYHFYLLVINLELVENAISKMQKLVCDKFEDKYKVTILDHTSSYVRKENPHQKYFFDHIIANGLLVYNSPLYLVFSKNFDSKRDMIFSKRYCRKRLLIAQQLFNLAQNCFNDDSIIIKKVLYRKTIEQIAIGLIYLYLGYCSAKISIHYLFSLLKYIQVDLPFDFKNEKEKQLYQFMTENLEISDHKEDDFDNIENNKMLEQKCIAFFEQANKLTDNAFKKLENENK
jgi:hypothetical protein